MTKPSFPLFFYCTVLLDLPLKYDLIGHPEQDTHTTAEHSCYYFLCSNYVTVLDSSCRKVAQREAETAGAIMAFFLSLGLALGAALSFGFRAMI